MVEKLQPSPEPEIPDPQYTRRDVNQLKSRMRHLRRLYIFRRGAPLVKAPGSNIRGWDDGHPEREDSPDDNRQQILRSQALHEISSSLSNGRTAPEEITIEPEQDTNGNSPHQNPDGVESFLRSEGPAMQEPFAALSVVRIKTSPRRNGSR